MRWKNKKEIFFAKIYNFLKMGKVKLKNFTEKDGGIKNSRGGKILFRGDEFDQKSKFKKFKSQKRENSMLKGKFPILLEK